MTADTWNVPHRFNPRPGGTQCRDCYGWRDDTRHLTHPDYAPSPVPRTAGPRGQRPRRTPVQLHS